MPHATIVDVHRLAIDEPFEVYNAAREQYLTSHQLIEFARNPLLYRKKRLGLVSDGDTESFRLGRATHTLILEGEEKFRREWVVGGPINPKTGAPYGEDTKAYAEWREQQGKPCVSDAEYLTCLAMRAGVLMHEEAAGILADGIAERTVRSEIHGFAVQARFDWLTMDARLADLKTCAVLDDFEADLWRYGYPWQQAFYLMVAHAAGLRLPIESTLIAVEKVEPFRCGVFKLTAPTLCACIKDLTAALWALRQANDQPSDWPTGAEGIRVVRRPRSLPAFGGEFIDRARYGAKEESWL